jgi:putative NADH-flavin reductase
MVKSQRDQEDRDMKIFLVGATGATGLAFITEALQDGHSITAYVRNPDKLPVRDPHLTIVQGTLDQLSSHVSGHNAFVSTLGHTALFDQRPYLSQAFTQILPALKQHQITRVVYESAYGIGETEADLPFLFRVVFKPLLLKHAYHDHSLVEQQLRASDLSWTIVRPTGLTNGPRTGQVVAAERLPKGSKSQISRADVAAYMLAALTKPQLDRKVLGLTGQ